MSSQYRYLKFSRAEKWTNILQCRSVVPTPFIYILNAKNSKTTRQKFDLYTFWM